MPAPDTIDLKRDRDLEGRESHPWIRRALLALVGIPLVLGLATAFGQRPTLTHAGGSGATLAVHAPARARGGLLYTASYRVSARRDVKKATLVLDPGWVSGMQVNSLSPQPLSEGSHDGKLVLVLGHVPAGQSYVQFIEFQVNPTTVGRRRQDVELLDGTKRLAVARRTLTVYP
jgi:hypothetical protein